MPAPVMLLMGLKASLFNVVMVDNKAVVSKVLQVIDADKPVQVYCLQSDAKQLYDFIVHTGINRKPIRALCLPPLSYLSLNEECDAPLVFFYACMLL